MNVDPQDLSYFASPRIRRFVPGKGWVVLDHPNKMRVDRKAVAKRRAHAKAVRKQKSQQRRKG